MPRIAVGDPAPDFELPTDDGERFRLSEHRGHPVVLFFYPQDDTEGCTIENREFSDKQPEFAALGAIVVGISPDTISNHCKFRQRFGLRTVLAADPERQVIERYQLWQQKKTFGRDYVGLVRTTFLVGPDGRIADAWTVNRIKGHADDVLAATRRLSSA